MIAMLRALVLTFAFPVTLAAISSARAQGADTLPKLALGEGRWQPNGKPIPIPDVSPAHAPRTTAPWSVRFARSVMQRNPQTHRRWDYTQGVVLDAILRTARVRRDTSMRAYVRRNIDRWVKPDGTIETYAPDEFNLDHVGTGRVLLALLDDSRNSAYSTAVEQLRQQLRSQPRTPEGGFWHKKIYPEQMWLDGLYMAEPFYAMYARSRGDTAAFTDVARQFLLMARHARDPRTNLMYHAWDAARKQPWADSVTGLSKNFWGRAMGWYLAGLVDALELFPPSHADRAALVETFRQVASGVARVQDPVTGLWWDVLDAPNRAGNYLEASASSLFAYAFAKGARLGLLDPTYRTFASRAFDGLLANLVRQNADGTVSLINIVQVSGLGGAPRKDGSLRDGTFAYYVSEPVVTDDFKGVGPFIMAALELGQ